MDATTHAAGGAYPNLLVEVQDAIRLNATRDAMASGSFSTRQVSTATPLQEQRRCARGTRIATLGNLLTPYTDS